MANNVNCKEMIFVIRNLVDVDDVFPATAAEILLMPARTTLVFPQRGRDDVAQLW